MNIDAIYILKELDRIKRCIEEEGDNEMAHTIEDDLHQAVLGIISKGSDKNAELAKMALQSRLIDFTRWYA